MYKTVFNPSDSAVVVSTDGHVIGGHDWGTIDTNDPVAKNVRDAGTVLDAEEPPEGSKNVNPAAAEAFAHTQELVDSERSASKNETDSADAKTTAKKQK